MLDECMSLFTAALAVSAAVSSAVAVPAAFAGRGPHPKILHHNPRPRTLHPDPIPLTPYMHVHFSAQHEPFVSLKPCYHPACCASNAYIELNRVDECKALSAAAVAVPAAFAASARRNLLQPVRG